MTDKLNIYVDANDLNDLSVLAKRAKDAQDILDNMHDYQMNYFESFLKTPKEVSEYIPESEIHLYQKQLDRILNIKWEKSSIRPKGYIVDTKNHSIIEVYYNCGSYYWGCTLYGDLKFTFNKDYSVLVAKMIHETHLGTCRSYKQCRCNDSWTIEYHFDTTNNTFIKVVSYKNTQSQLHNLVH